MIVASYRKTMAGARRIAAERVRALPPPQTARIAPSAPVAAPEPIMGNVVPFKPKPSKALRRARARQMPEWARAVTAEVAAARMIAPEHILGRSRAFHVVRGRYDLFYRLKTDSRQPSFMTIARWFDRDHTGILWGAATHAMEHGLPAVTTIDMPTRIAWNRARNQQRPGPWKRKEK